MHILTIEGLTKRYPTFTLDSVSFSVKAGEIMGFIGRNGAGKTTTLKALLNIVHPDAGMVHFFGVPFVANELAIKQRIGFVSGGIDYYPRSKLSAISEVTKRFHPSWDPSVYREYMNLFALDENKTPSQLSAGMKVKYNLALALSHHAELLILDEPTSGLDPVSRDELLDIFNMLAQKGTSILFSTHITSDLDKCADRITYIRNGHILASEELASFRQKYRALTFSDDALTNGIRDKIIGLKPAKVGFTAIALEADAQPLGLSGSTADLDTIMVHLEKE